MSVERSVALRQDGVVEVDQRPDAAELRALRWADVAVVAVVVIVIALAFATPVAADRRWIAIVAMAVVGALWLAMRARLARSGTAPAWRVAVLCVVGFACTITAPWLAIAQAVLHPLVWMGTERRLHGVLGSGLLAASVAAGWIAHAPEDWWAALATQAGSWAFSVWFGLWIDSMDRLSSERRRLVEQLEASREEAAALASEQGASRERDRIAREVHDTIAQDLAGVVMLLEGVRASATGADAVTLQRAEDAARRSLADARALVAGEIALEVDGRGLAATIDAVARRWAAESGHVVVVDAVSTQLDRESQVVLLRSLQEALSNVRRHAGAERVRVTLDAEGDDVVLRVDDDGSGLPDPLPTDAGFGLAAMARRAMLAGGAVATAASPLGGTRVEVRIRAHEPREMRS